MSRISGEGNDARLSGMEQELRHLTELVSVTNEIARMEGVVATLGVNLQPMQETLQQYRTRFAELQAALREDEARRTYLDELARLNDAISLTGGPEREALRRQREELRASWSPPASWTQNAGRPNANNDQLVQERQNTWAPPAESVRRHQNAAQAPVVQPDFSGLEMRVADRVAVVRDEVLAEMRTPAAVQARDAARAASIADSEFLRQARQRYGNDVTFSEAEEIERRLDANQVQLALRQQQRAEEQAEIAALFEPRPEPQQPAAPTSNPFRTVNEQRAAVGHFQNYNARGATTGRTSSQRPNHTAISRVLPSLVYAPGMLLGESRPIAKALWADGRAWDHPSLWFTADGGVPIVEMSDRLLHTSFCWCVRNRQPQFTNYVEYHTGSREEAALQLAFGDAGAASWLTERHAFRGLLKECLRRCFTYPPDVFAWLEQDNVFATVLPGYKPWQDEEYDRIQKPQRHRRAADGRPFRSIVLNTPQ